MFELSVADVRRTVEQIGGDSLEEQLVFLKEVRRKRSVDMDQAARRMLKEYINQIRHRLGRCY
jgi:uncharacterized membrane-anchored protein YjiN (DUF445 family)